MAWLCATAAWVFRVSRRGSRRVSRAGGGCEAEVDGAVGDVRDDCRRRTADRREGKRCGEKEKPTSCEVGFVPWIIS
jgi:hypothetical protein